MKKMCKTMKFVGYGKQMATIFSTYVITFMSYALIRLYLLKQPLTDATDYEFIFLIPVLTGVFLLIPLFISLHMVSLIKGLKKYRFNLPFICTATVIFTLYGTFGNDINVRLADWIISITGIGRNNIFFFPETALYALEYALVLILVGFIWRYILRRKL